MATTAQSAHFRTTALAPSSSSPLSEHAPSPTFPSLSESGSEEDEPTKNSTAELTPQAKDDDTQRASLRQGLTKGINPKQSSVSPESNKSSPKQPLDHGQQPQQGLPEGKEPALAQDEGSLTLTEISDSEEEIDEELTEVSEDTVFEETLPTTGKAAMCVCVCEMAKSVNDSRVEINP